MKLLTGFLAAATTLAIGTACNDARDRYVDLRTGESVELVKDEQSGLLVSAETKQPVRIYVDTKTKDTIWGKTGVVINGSLAKDAEGIYFYSADYDRNTPNSDGSYKLKDGDYKKKVEKDGDVKIKDGDTKTKIDGETGEVKVKKD